VLKPTFVLVVSGVQALGRIALWLWHNAIAPAFKAIGTLIALWWNGVKVTFNAVRSFITGPLASTFTWLWRKVIQPVWAGIKTTISTVWSSGIKPVFGTVKTAVGLVRDAFARAADGIGKVWSGIKSATKKPVSFVVDTVYNNGIRKVWNVV
ncbi:hypothetical protein, partial [Escherichia coli]